MILCCCRRWIGNAAEDGKMGTVFARLKVPSPDGSGALDDHGVHAFIVPLRDAEHHCFPGVEIKDCGYKVCPLGRCPPSWLAAIPFAHASPCKAMSLSLPALSHTDMLSVTATQLQCNIGVSLTWQPAHCVCAHFICAAHRLGSKEWTTGRCDSPMCESPGITCLTDLPQWTGGASTPAPTLLAAALQRR